MADVENMTEENWAKAEVARINAENLRRFCIESAAGHIGRGGVEEGPLISLAAKIEEYVLNGAPKAEDAAKGREMSTREPIFGAGELSVLLYHYWSGADEYTGHPQLINATSFYDHTVARLRNLGLMEMDSKDLTEKGRNHVEGLLSVPLPVLRWVAAA